MTEQTIAFANARIFDGHPPGRACLVRWCPARLLYRPPGLADAFGGACPPTFRAEYLPADATPHCIDFILTAGEVKVEATALVFAEKEPLGYVSDHIGLRARLFLTPSRQASEIG